MRISVKQLRRIINEAVAGEVADGGPSSTEYVNVDVGLAKYYPGLVDDIAWRKSPSLFVDYDPASGIAKLHMPDMNDPEEHDLVRELENFKAAIASFQELVDEPSPAAQANWSKVTRR